MSQSGALKAQAVSPTTVLTLTGNTGPSVPPDGLGNINTLGNTGTGINVAGNAATNTLTFFASTATTTQQGTVTLATNAQAIAGVDSSNAVTSSALAAKLGTQTAHSLAVFEGTSSAITALGAATNGQIPIGSTGLDPVLATLTAGTGVSIANGAGSITVSAAASVATTYNADSGSATPALNVLTLAGSGSITSTGAGSTITYALTGLTNHNVLVGAGTSTITKVAPSATSGVPLISQGAAADPAFGTAVVAGGGTGQVTLTAHSVLVGNGTTAITQVGPSATAGAVFLSTGSTTDPAFIAPTAGTGLSVTTNGTTLQYALSTPVSIANGGTNATSFSTTNGVVYFDGTRLLTTTAGTAGQVITSNGAGLAPTYQAGPKLVLISSQTASNSASITFIGLTSPVPHLLLIDGAQPVTNTASLQMVVSQDNGSTFLNTGYTCGVNYNAYNSTTVTNSNSTSLIPLSGPISSVGLYSANIILHNINVGNSLSIDGLSSWNDTTLATTANGRMGGQTSTGINAIKLQMSSGNINAGTFTLYKYLNT